MFGDETWGVAVSVFVENRLSAFDDPHDFAGTHRDCNIVLSISDNFSFRDIDIS